MSRRFQGTLTRSSLIPHDERADAEAIGLPVTFRPEETWRPPFQDPRNENGWRAVVTDTSRTCDACLQRPQALAL